MIVFGPEYEKHVFGSGRKKLCIVTCLHGDEKEGLTALKILERLEGIDGKVKVIVANLLAVKHDKRFLESDLNRVFPGSRFGNYEERLAREIVREVRRCPLVVDLHSTSTFSPPFAISTKEGQKHLELASLTGVKRLVLMGDEIAKGKALIDHCRTGISIELGKKGSYAARENCRKIISNLLVNLGMIEGEGKASDPRIYRTMFFLRAPEGGFECSLHNFSYVKKGQIIGKGKGTLLKAREPFYSILVGEEHSDLLLIGVKEVGKDA